MLEYEDLDRRMKEIKERITAGVLEREQTQQVGNVKATYRKGRKSYDYQAVCEDAPDDVVEQYTKVRKSVSWSKVALEGLGIPRKEIPFSVGEPSVSIKVVG
jgi:hypothetical protein